MKWHSGPPPFPGWWNASSYRSREAWRWWDGERWSSVATPAITARAAAEQAARPALYHPEFPPIKWTHYWPAGARVPRVEPEA